MSVVRRDANEEMRWKVLMLWGESRSSVERGLVDLQRGARGRVIAERNVDEDK